MSDRIFTRFTAFALLIAMGLTAVLMAAIPGEAQGVDFPYEEAIFDPDSIMTVEISVPQEDWEEMLANARAKEYIAADIAINGEALTSVGIRCKGNSSLTQVGDTDRYSFKIQFDEYIGGQTLLGLDKMVLNNTQSDPTWMKEYLVYYMMHLVGVDAPLYAFANIYVNGTYWGLYLAVEVLEESYAERCFGRDYGELYKVESMDMGGGGGGAPGDRGGGRSIIDPQDMFLTMDAERMQEMIDRFTPEQVQNMLNILAASSDEPVTLPEGVVLPEGVSIPEPGTVSTDDLTPQGGAAMLPSDAVPPGAASEEDAMVQDGTASEQTGEQTEDHGRGLMHMDAGGFAMFMGGNGADLIYTDDDLESYSAIFDNTVFKTTTDADKARVVAALKGITDEQSDISDYVYVDEMLRYIAANTAVGNGDGYFGSMMHNFYLYEKDGKITMLPWDYNLAYGGFGGTVAELINLDIDEPYLSGDGEDRPIVSRLLENEEYLETYHAYIQTIGEFYVNGAASLIDTLDGMIREWVALDPTKEYTLEEYEASLPVFKEYLALRGQSMLNQVNGDDTPVDTDGLALQALGGNSMSGGRGGRGGPDGADGWMQESRDFANPMGGASMDWTGAQAMPMQAPGAGDETGGAMPENPEEDGASTGGMADNPPVQESGALPENASDEAGQNAGEGAAPAGAEDASQGPMAQFAPPNGAFDGGAFPQDNWRMDSSSSTGAQTSEKAALYLGVCAAVLVVALVFAKVYPFHKRLR